MGTLLTPHCPACGFESNWFYFGAGMRDFDTKTNVPALDTRTGELTSLNIKESNTDPDIVPYTDPSMHEGPIDKEKAHEWSETWLAEDRNKCPRCGRFTLRFDWAGNYD